MINHIDIKAEASALDTRITEEVERMKALGYTIKLVDIVATNDASVLSYCRTKTKKAATLGITYEVLHIPSSMNADAVLATVDRLNQDDAVTGIMLSTPTYAHLNAEDIVSAIASAKDIDGLSPTNVAALVANREDRALVPATALAAIHIVERITGLQGKHIVVLGRGRTVGRPVAQMALNRHATVTICHSQTQDIPTYTRSADILITAIGKPAFVGREFIQPQQIVIDCGISFKDGRIRGDVDPESVGPVVHYLTPVPGGVGVLTNSYLFANLMKAVSLLNAARSSR